MTSETFNEDCMIGMARYPDKYFDLAVVDPPYGIGIMKQWDNDVPNENYFRELKRVSKNQIIWGGNYFPLPPSQCWLIWDKGQRDFSLADGEMAWTSFDKAMRIFTYSRGKHMSVKANIHPTEKPTALYSWIYKNYLPEGGKVIDTHLGSGSNRIAATKAGNIDFIGYELDKDYFEAQEKRFKDFKSQTVMEFV